MDVNIEEKKEENNNKEIITQNKSIDKDKETNNTNNEKGNFIYYITTKEKRITKFKLGMNTLLSLLLIFFFLYIPYQFDDRRWRIFFYMTLWSFSMNAYYIVSVTFIDWIHFIKKNTNLCPCYNNFVRNLYLKICFPFSIAIVFLYWLLILLGDDFEFRGRDVTDTVTGVFFHGIILIFLLFDMFTAVHINKVNYLWDLIIISILVCIYFVILGFGKYAMEYEPYDFMEMSSVRQIIGAAILIYIAILDGYVIYNLIANRFFEKEEKKLNNFNNYENIIIDNQSFSEINPLNAKIDKIRKISSDNTNKNISHQNFNTNIIPDLKNNKKEGIRKMNSDFIIY